MSQDFDRLIKELSTVIAEKILVNVKEKVNGGLKKFIQEIDVKSFSVETLSKDKKGSLLVSDDVVDSILKNNKRTPVKVTVKEANTPIKPSKRVKKVATSPVGISPVDTTEMVPVVLPLTLDFSGSEQDVTPIKEVKDTDVKDKGVKDKEGYDYKEFDTINTYLSHQKFLIDADLDQLPPHYKGAILELNRKDNKTAKMLLAMLPVDKWIDFIEGRLIVSISDIYTEGMSKCTQDWIDGYFLQVCAKILKVSKKVARAQEVAAANLKKIENAREKKRLLAEKQAAKKEADLEARRLLMECQPAPPCELYTPQIEKRSRVKIGIIGVLPAKQDMIQKEFGDTFCLAMSDVGTGVINVRNIVEGHDKKIFVLVDFVSHCHINLIDKRCLAPVRGGFYQLKKALSDYAKECYPEV